MRLPEAKVDLDQQVLTNMTQESLKMRWPEFFSAFGNKRSEQCEKCEYFKELKCEKLHNPKLYHVGIIEPKDLHADFDCEDFRCKIGD